MQIIYGILAATILICFAAEVAHWFAFGGFISEKNLNLYLSKNLDDYKLNPYSDKRDMLSHTGQRDLPFISIAHSPLSKWYIENNGSIPRWSPWSRKLDTYLNNLTKDLGPLPKDITNFID